MNPIPKILIGIAGTNGAGKDSVANEMMQSHGFLYVSVSDILRAECKARGLKPIRKNTSMVSAEWRREFGMGVLVDKSIDKFNEMGGNDKYTGLISGSIRNSLEAQHLLDQGGKMLWVDADPKVRYERLQSGRSRDSDDKATFEEWRLEEQREAQREGDAATLDGAAVEPLSELRIVNDGTTEDLTRKINDLVKTLLQLSKVN